jgi:hypothetical protein
MDFSCLKCLKIILLHLTENGYKTKSRIRIETIRSDLQHYLCLGSESAWISINFGRLDTDPDTHWE